MTASSPRLHGRRGLLVATIALALIAVGALLAFGPLSSGSGDAEPESDGLEQQALAIERQLLCPQCTNKRLDVCELAICKDMQRTIRDRLATGDPPDDIIFYFRNRYGQRVLAEIPKEGFNLVLFGWVGGSLLLVGTAGAVFLTHLGRAGRVTETNGATSTSETVDDAWLDEEIARDGVDHPDDVEADTPEGDRDR